MGYTELFCIPDLTSEFVSSCDSVLGDSLVFYKLKTFVSGNFGRSLKEVKPLVVYDGEQGILLEPMQENWA